MDMVDKRVQLSVRYVKEYVEEYMKGHLESACHAVQEYGRRYVDTMSEALRAGKAGASSPLPPAGPPAGYLQMVPDHLVPLAPDLSHVQARLRMHRRAQAVRQALAKFLCFGRSASPCAP